MKDLRKDFDWELEDVQLPEGHQQRFKAKLPKQKKQILWIKIAAVLIIALLSSVIIYQNSTFITDDQQMADEDNINQEVNLKNISPDLATLENYYETTIQLEIASLSNSNTYQEMVNTYFDELEALEKEYKNLKQQLLSAGSQRTIIRSMIENLQLRLELLQELDQRINELNQLDNENYQNNTI